MSLSLTPDNNRPAPTNSEGEDYKKVDWTAYNQHLFEQIGNDNQVGIIAQITDLGFHEQEDFKFEWTGTPEEELDQKEGTYFEDGTEGEDKGKRFKRWPRKDVQEIAISVDFPDIMINYGKYFSESGEDEFRPYRHIMNREWDQVLQGYGLEKKPGIWTFAPKSYIRKISKACGLEDAVCDQKMDVGKLLGGVFCCDLNATKNVSGDKTYVNVRVGVPTTKHSKIPTPEYDITPVVISVSNENSPEDLEFLNGTLLNKIKASQKWEGSALQAQLESRTGDSSPKEGDSNPPEEKPVEEQPEAPEGDEDWDEDLPF